MIEQIIENRKEQHKPVLYKGEMYDFFDEGNTRYVYVNGDRTKVIKICKEEKFYEQYNQLEYDLYNKSQEKHLLAETTLDEQIIIQEFCLPIKWCDKTLTPKEIRFALSCRNEVGWNKNDVLVCFDLDEFKKY